MSRNTLSPVSYPTYEAFCGWVDPSMPTLNRFDFVTYLDSNFPDAERPASTLKAIADYRTTLQEIVDTESELVNLRIEVVRPQLAKELETDIPPTSSGDSYAAIDRDILDATERNANTALRKFERSHLSLRLRKAQLEVTILSAEAPAVEKRLSEDFATISPLPTDIMEFTIPEFTSHLTTLLTNTEAKKASRTALLAPYPPQRTERVPSSVQRVRDPRDRAPSLSHSQITAASSRPPLTPRTSPRKARPVWTSTAQLPDGLHNK